MKKIDICIFKPENLLLDCIKEMTERAKIESSHSLGVVLDGKKLIGSLSDGDIRRYLVSPSADITSDTINDVMHKYPFSIIENDIDSIDEKITELNRKINCVFITDSDNNYLYTIEINDFLKESKTLTNYIPLEDFDKTIVVGLGFVGLTLAVHIAKSGFSVIGVDNNLPVVDNLNKKIIPFYEQGLQSALDELDDDSLVFKAEIPEIDSNTRNVFIIAVGTPIINNRANFDQLKSSIKSINTFISDNDLLIIRSTVPMGTCKEFITQFIDQDKKIHICMAPERTAEGVALSELQILPQIIGADDLESQEIAEKYFAKFSISTISVGSTAAAEICKLVCNSWRDLNFGFANELALLCEDMEIDAFDLINSCNMGYKRMNMPLPSPGVGGYCLTKDPLLYANSGSSASNLFSGALSKSARQANVLAGMAPDRALNEFINKNADYKNRKLKILVCGVTFKGAPETDDIRFSTSMEFVNRMIDDGNDVYISDASKMAIKKLEDDYKIFNFDQKVDADFDGIFILNNNPQNIELNYSDWLNEKKDKIFFDGWHQFASYKYNFKVKNITYTTMGVIR